MLKRVVLGLALLGSGCTGDAAKDLYETAQLEEKQNNDAHAKELYQQITTQHRQSEYAAKAKERLRVLNASP